MKTGFAKTESFDLGLTTKEKQAFRETVELAGLPLSAWVHERLHFAAWRELEDKIRSILFIPNNGA